MEPAIRACLLLFAAGAGASPMMKHELRSSKALDGSPAIYYLRAVDPAAKKWIVSLQGGGMCHDQKECIGRKMGGLGTSGVHPEQFNATDYPDGMPSKYA